MPFTPAHSVAVLGLKKRFPRFLSLTGLVVGSMIPDFTYFFPIPGFGPHYLHSLKGTLIFSMPFGIACSMFALWVREPMVELLGYRERRALRPIARLPIQPGVRNCFVLVGSLAIGIATHIFWDSFTHRNGFFVKRFAFLQHPMWWADSSVFNSLQHTSDVLGLAFLFWLWQKWRQRQVVSDSEFRALREETTPIAAFWVLIFVMALLVSIGFTDLHALFSLNHFNWEVILLPIVMHFGSSLLATFSLCLLVLKLSGSRSAAKNPET